jgi:hypothetical protein
VCGRETGVARAIVALESASVFAACPLVIDNPEKTQQLLAVLKAALPFEVDLTTELLATLMKDQSSAGLRRRQTVTGVIPNPVEQFTESPLYLFRAVFGRVAAGRAK